MGQVLEQWTETDKDGRTVYCERVYEFGKVRTFREKFGTKPLSEVLMDSARKHLYKPRQIARWSNIRWSKPCRCMPMPPVYRTAFEAAAHQRIMNGLNNALEAMKNG
ncbi:hypothetical protein [Alicyclobacillus dauci]|uniref:Uncharacterized protein n=1 Tax=Alicyclobacillus dauci TaxID=1475485 RepID=A0ABY6ZBG3_9BACL|nr:hypothetical protein [Alicyclobacillus dauci]WAH39516.1 hypothetical protein NZD86_24425 [Alicyclobacillus dauci]WAH39576.1 hypothetical protein NZD86_24125 [Alicyclobacillus dauci]